jgi:hypothetical protein
MTAVAAALSTDLSGIVGPYERIGRRGSPVRPPPATPRSIGAIVSPDKMTGM